MNLPESYLQKMKGVLQDEYENYLQAMQEAPVTSIRINTGKITVEEFQKI